MRQFQTLLLLLIFLFPIRSQALSLQEGLKIVAGSGRDVKIARSGENAARSAVDLARAPWLPQMDLYGRETWLRYQPEAKFGVNIVPTSQDRYLAYGVRATQMLYDFGKTSSAIDAARFNLRVSEIETYRARNRSALEFILAYYDLLEAEKLLQVASDEVKRYEAHKHDAEAKYSGGVVTRNEVLQADVSLADSQQRYLAADNQRSLRASRINSLLLRPLNEPVQTEEVQKNPSSGISLETAWAVAETESPELQSIEAGIRAKEESIAAIRAEYLPTLYLSGGYEYLENRYLVHQDNWSLIAGINLNLLSGGSTSSRIHIAGSELSSLRQTRDKIADAVRLDVKSAYLEIESATRRIEVAKTALAQAEENLRLQRLRYQEGVGTAIEVLDAVTLLSSTQSSIWRALYGFERAEAALLYSMGRDLTGMYAEEANSGSEASNPK